MKNNTTTIAIMAVVAIGAGLARFTFATGDSSSPQSATSLAVKPLMSGHLLVEVTDEFGNVKDVREADNIVTVKGENCAVRLLFTEGAQHDQNVGVGDCIGGLTNGFTFIGVGTGTTQEIGTQLTLVTEATLERERADTITWSNSTAAVGDSGDIEIKTTFASVANGPFTITEAGLFNDTRANDATDAMFARKTFPGVTVNDGDSLTVTWTIQIGNTTSFN
ncbi:hypothetical protein AAA799E16_00839 [Marine Group I thaumarchaeote SCGC AAA799-E16]|uniref:Uncharacterized protein n=2 Tax=Marine Group I TaxID=905826 RepID=A0A087S502_9ARCH|nr:hypothetical protein AAA799E16_00839 [Marine Group I thaumarchaeote SCGC AAA799-E16]KFM20806.1 hypothetical protein SCCGRSA3_00108 [Marine Group I thaumarchaeote SCGC RSA3]